MPLALRRYAWLAMLLGAAALASCGFVQPGRPGHEPPGGGNYNPISHERNGALLRRLCRALPAIAVANAPDCGQSGVAAAV